MSYNKGQGQFGATRGNMWAMIRQLTDSQGAMNAGDQYGGGGLQVTKATYDFALDGGAIGTILLNQSPMIPAGAIVLGAIIDPITTLTSGGGATLAMGIGNGASAAAFKAAAAFGTYVGGTPLAALPIWSGGFFKLAADGKVSVTIAGGTITGGKVAVHFVWVPAGE